MKAAGQFINAFITKRAPFSLVHFVTDRCNARCPHCFVDFEHPAPADTLLSLEEIRQLAGTLGPGLYNVNLTGGEPFLRDDLFDIVSAYFKHSTVQSIVITSNGTLTDSVSLFLDKLRILDFKGRVKISISIDHIEDKHDALRRIPGAFAKALETYRLVDDSRDKRLMADIALTVTPYNYEDIQDIYASLVQRGVKNVTAILMRDEGVARRQDKQQEVLQAYRTLLFQIRSARSRSSERSAGHRISEALRAGKNLIAADIVTGRQVLKSPIPCRAGSLLGVVYPNGDVHPCEMLGPSWCFGNLRGSGMDFLRLWKSGIADAMRIRLSDMRCSCTYECALSVNIMTNPRLLTRVLALSCGHNR